MSALNSNKVLKTSHKSRDYYNFETLFSISFVCIVFFSFLLSGLYEEKYYLLFGFIILTLLLIMLIFQGNNISINYLTALCLLTVLTYGISIAEAADIRAAVLKTFLQFVYLAVFIIVINIMDTEKKVIRLFYGIFLTASFMSLTAFFVKGNILNIEKVINGGRFASQLEYANVFALFLTIIIIILYSISTFGFLDKRNIKYLLFKFLIIINTIALLETKSRGGFLVYIFTMILLFLFTRMYRKNIGHRILLLNMISILILFIATSLQGFLYLVCVLILPILFLISINMASNYFLKKKIYEKYFSKIFLAALLVVTIPMLFSTDLVKRLSTLSLNDANTIARLLFYSDGLRILKEHYLIGAGGGGWAALYQKYQGHAYHTVEAHSYPIQLVVETGIIGTVINIAFLVVILHAFIKRFIKNELAWYQITAFLGCIGIILHSLIDFSLSIPAISILFYSLLGVLSQKTNQIMYIKPNVIRNILISICIFFMLFSSASLYSNKVISKIVIDRAGLSLNEVKRVENEILKGIRLDPLKSDNYGYLGQLKISIGKSSNNQDLISEGIKLIEKAVKMEPNDINKHLVMAEVLRSLNMKEEAIKLYRDAINQAPLKNNGYDFLFGYFIELGKKEKDNTYFQLVINDIFSLRGKMDGVSAERKELWVGDFLGYSVQQSFFGGQAFYYLGNFEQGIELFEEALKSKSDILSNEIENELKTWIVFGESYLNKKLSYQVDDDILLELSKNFKI